MVVKLRPGWAYNAKGKAVPKEALDVGEALSPLLQGLTPPAKRWSRDNGSKPKARDKLKHPYVLDGRVKMTPRRYELLSVVFTGLLDWVLDAEWNYHLRHSGPVDHIMMPLWLGKRVESTITTLHQLRLIRWTRGTVECRLTASGLEAMEQYEAHLNT